MAIKKLKFSYGILATILVFLVIFPSGVLGDCTCDDENEERDKNKALKYKIASIVSILIAGAIGVCIPVLGKKVQALHPEKKIFFIIKAFAAGVILSTGFIHILPDAFENLTSPCLSEHPWGDFPFTGLLAMVGAIGTLMIDSFATAYYKKQHFDSKSQTEVTDVETVQQGHEGHVHLHTHATHGHAHGSDDHSSEVSTNLLRHRVISQVLELGIVVHSVIIGLSLGASQNPKTIRPLVAALTFHQFFEGMGLGSCISQAKFTSRSVTVMTLFFSLTTPVGIAIGIGIANVYNENSPTALIVEGTLNAAAAGILIYMSLVDLLAADFMSTRMQNNLKLHVGANLSLLLGAGCMALLAKWA